MLVGEDTTFCRRRRNNNVYSEGEREVPCCLEQVDSLRRRAACIEGSVLAAEPRFARRLRWKIVASRKEAVYRAGTGGVVRQLLPG